MKRAEVAFIFPHSTEVTLFIDGEPRQQTIQRSEITRWWDTFLPQDGSYPMPFWVKETAHFESRTQPDYTARIMTIKNDWVSFLETSKVHGTVFRIKPYAEFEMQWSVLHRPSAYDWLRNPVL